MEVVTAIRLKLLSVLLHGERKNQDGDDWHSRLSHLRSIFQYHLKQRPQSVQCSAPTAFTRRSVFSWGSGLQGQLGHGDHANQSLPRTIDYLASCLSSDDSIRQCSCGSFHTGCVSDTGRLFTWGRANDNCLGHGVNRSSADQPLPKEVNLGHPEIQTTYVSCGDTHSLALTTDGRVLSWGLNHHYQCGREHPPPSPSSSVAAGYAPVSSSLFKSRSSVSQPQSQLSSSSLVATDPWSHRLQVTDVMSAGVVEGFPPNTEIIDVCCGKLHSIALSQEGDVYVWGSHREGALGLGDETETIRSTASASSLEQSASLDYRVPTKIDGAYFDHKRIVKVAAGFHFSAAVSEDGKLYTFGSDQYGQLGHGKESRCATKPLQVRSLSGIRVKDIACGHYHMAAITEAGDLYTWGYGREGQLGHAEKADHSIPTRVQKVGDGNRSVSCGGGHTAVVDKDFRLWMMGRGRDGQLGRADVIESVVADRLEPFLVEFLKAARMQVAAVSLGQEHSLAICFKDVGV